jgi:hypothetical protein
MVKSAVAALLLVYAPIPVNLTIRLVPKVLPGMENEKIEVADAVLATVVPDVALVRTNGIA